MYRTFFKQIAKKENGKFYYEDTTGLSSDGVAHPHVLFLLKIEYKNHIIIVDNRTGSSFVGTAILKLDSVTKPVDFEISSISHFMNLFLRKKNRFSIKSNNHNIKHFLNNNKAYNRLCEIGKKTRFSPVIKVQLDNNSNKIITKYHLQFDNWMQVVEPIIEFYKNLADEFDRNLSFLSSSQYREMN